MIIVRLYGGLGNQMFQYAAGLALSEQWKTPLKLDIFSYQKYSDESTHDRYSLSAFNIVEQFATEDEIGKLRGFQLKRIERLWLKVSRTLLFPDRFKEEGHWHSAARGDFNAHFFQLPPN